MYSESSDGISFNCVGSKGRPQSRPWIGLKTFLKVPRPSQKVALTSAKREYTSGPEIQTLPATRRPCREHVHQSNSISFSLCQRQSLMPMRYLMPPVGACDTALLLFDQYRVARGATSVKAIETAFVDFA